MCFKYPKNTQTWIDVISDQLVNVLEFIGVCLRVPSSVMGMTVLAWGNSVGDYTTNGALAAKGLADMSMSAWCVSMRVFTTIALSHHPIHHVVLCWYSFAGPSFNLLVGLGLGLLTQKEALLSGGLPVQLIPSVQTGFIFLICNCMITVISGYYHKGIIPKM